MTEDLLAGFQLGTWWLAKRMVMAPMTGNRADENAVITPLTATDETVFTTCHGGDEKGYADCPASAQEQAA